ncbi:hypothetical protein Y032_0006g2811 [Ancylostoma ceylanicum]|nr:hypothetical protein Y032_0006g2811 [Ancylostoma ceylanicum]
MTTILGDGIDLLILSIFFHFRSGTGKDVSTGDLQCAEHESDNRFGLNYRFIDFIDFFHLRSGTGENMVINNIILLSTSEQNFVYPYRHIVPVSPGHKIPATTYIVKSHATSGF